MPNKNPKSKKQTKKLQGKTLAKVHTLMIHS
jgi:hypothetical protein